MINMARKKIKITAVNPVSLGTFVGTFYAIIGVAIGLVLAFSSTFVAWFGHEGLTFFQGLGFGLAVGVLGIIILPVIYFIIGWIQGAIFGFMFNIATSYMGGLEIETE